MGGSDVSILLDPGSHVDTHPFGETFLFFGFATPVYGDFGFFGIVPVGRVLGCGCLGLTGNDEALGVIQKN